MKVLLVNKFFYPRGGSEVVFFNTAEILRAHGHSVSFFAMDHENNLPSEYSRFFPSRVDLEGRLSLGQQARAAGRMLYSFSARRRMAALLTQEKPDIVHLHNVHHQLSLSILQAVHDAGIPAVMTLHDYKVVCPVYTLLGRGRLCDRCRRRRYYHCFLRRCTRNSYPKSLLNALEMTLQDNLLGLPRRVRAYISPSLFLKKKVAEMGFRGQVFYLPNCLDRESFAPLPSPVFTGGEVVYFGRLSPEKGLATLLRALRGLDLPCRIIGDGPLRSRLESLSREFNLRGVTFSGYLSELELKRAVERARFVVIPSEWYENSPLSVLEAFALGKPVLASRIGGLPELVRDGETGLTFEPGRIEELQDKMRILWNDPEWTASLGRRARTLVEQRHGPEAYYQDLMAIYSQARRES